jgi:hypothetical protein
VLQRNREGGHLVIKTCHISLTHSHSIEKKVSSSLPHSSLCHSLKRTNNLFFKGISSSQVLYFLYNFHFIFCNPFLYFIIKTASFYIFYTHNLETISFSFVRGQIFFLSFSLSLSLTHTHTHTHKMKAVSVQARKWG